MTKFSIDFRSDSPFLTWLELCAYGWQFGEQGVLVAIDELLMLEGICVEIGAGNGDTLPLTIDPMYMSGRRCVMFEADAESREALSRKYEYGKAEVRGIYSVDDRNTLPIDTAICIIDVDSNDSELFESIVDYREENRPDCVMVEHMDRHFPLPYETTDRLPSWALGMTLIGGFRLQDTAEALRKIATDNGYSRVGVTRCNSIFVKDELFSKLLKPIGSR